MNGESVRTASELRSATSAARSASGATIARPRAVEARPGAPVAVDLDDDRRIAPRERPPGKGGEGLVRALREDRVRRRPPQLARDADR